MNQPSDRLLADRLGDYWDHLLSGGQGDGAVPPPPDPSLAETVRRLHAARPLAAPPRRFTASLWEDLMDAPLVIPPPRAGGIGGKAPRRLVRLLPAFELAAVLVIVLSTVTLLASRPPDLSGRLGALLDRDQEERASQSVGFGALLFIPAEDPGGVEAGLYRVVMEPGSTLVLPVSTNGMLAAEEGAVVVDTPAVGPTTTTVRAASSLAFEAGATVRQTGSRPAELSVALFGVGAATFGSGSGSTVSPLFAGMMKLPSGDALVQFDLRTWTADDYAEFDAGERGAVFLAVAEGAVAVGGQGGNVDLTVADLQEQAGALNANDPREVVLKQGDRIVVEGGAFLYATPRMAGSRTITLWVNPDPEQPRAGQDISVAAFGTPEPPPPAGTPAGAATVPAAAGCTIAPVTPADLAAIRPATPAAEARDAVYEQDLPTGTPVDEATLAAITAVEQQFAACYNAGDTPRLLATLSSRVLAESMGDLLEGGAAEVFAAAPEPLNPDEQIALFPLRGARVLPDGRVGAIVEWGTGAEPSTVDERNFRIYVQIDGRWYADEEVPLLN